jgi:ubiquinone/menaquinone biosynthesis C-methylase UbiE
VGGVCFDRAASFYDATRALPADVRSSLDGMLAGELAGRGACLEIGVGTGRIALPLHDLGIPMTGTDISAGMLNRLVANAAETPDDRHSRTPFPLLRGDGTDLPLRAASFGAVMASHVLHLIPAWRAAVDEAIRVLRPAGLLLVDFGGLTPAPWHALSHSVFEAHGIGHVRPGVSDPEPVLEYLGPRASLRTLPAVEITVHRSPRQDIDDWERQIHAWTWPYDAGQMRAACRALRARVAEEGWLMDTQVELTNTIQWWAFDLGP